jgi:hypothetical protein
MVLIRSLLIVLLCGLAIWAKPSRGVPQSGDFYAYKHKLGRYQVVLGDYDPVTETSMVRVFLRGRLWSEHMVEGDWDDSQILDIFALKDGSFAVSGGNGFLAVLMFPPDFRKPPAYFTFSPPAEATPWAVPGYQLNWSKGRLVVELVFDTPEGVSRDGKPTFVWTGSGFDFIRRF